MRLWLLGALVLAALARPAGADAQSYCVTGYQTASSPFSSYDPNPYTANTGFASFPGAYSSGLLPAGYSTSPQNACAPGTSPSGGSSHEAAAYGFVYPSNVYNPYGGYGVTNAASYPYVPVTQGGYAGTWGSGSTGSSSGVSGYQATSWTPSSGYSFASFPGMAPSGYLTSPSAYGQGSNASGGGGSASPFNAYSSYGATDPHGSVTQFSAYGTYGTTGYSAYGTVPYPGYASGSTSSGPQGTGYSPYGATAYPTGYSGYGTPASTSTGYSGPATMIVWGR